MEEIKETIIKVIKANPTLAVVYSLAGWKSVEIVQFIMGLFS